MIRRRIDRHTRNRWVISRHAAPGLGRWLYWHPTKVYAWTNNQRKAARFGTYTEAVRASETITYKDRVDIGRL